jgi:hypothetical protein
MSAAQRRVSISNYFNFDEFDNSYLYPSSSSSAFSSPEFEEMTGMSKFAELSTPPSSFFHAHVLSSSDTSDSGSEAGSSFSMNESSDLDMQLMKFHAACDEDANITASMSLYVFSFFFASRFFTNVFDRSQSLDLTYPDYPAYPQHAPESFYGGMNDAPAFAENPEQQPQCYETIPEDSDGLNVLPISLSLSPRSARYQRRSFSFTVKEDEEYHDDAGENSDGSDEYVPCSFSARKRFSSVRQSTVTSRRETSRAERSEATKPYSRRVRAPPGPRNKQSQRSLAPHKVSTLKSENDDETLVCPECGWTQSTARSPDFNRHLLTHNRPPSEDQSQGWWCKGVLASDAHLHDIPEGTEGYVFNGQERIGGCLQTFSRRDALKRHLDNEKIHCSGRPCWAAYD